MNYRRLNSGDMAPLFTQKSASVDNMAIDRLGGRYILLAFIGSAADEIGLNMFSFVRKNRMLFDDDKLSFFGVTLNAKDITSNKLPTLYPGIRQFADYDGKISRLYGALPEKVSNEEQVNFLRQWVLIDPMLRIHSIFTVKNESIEQEQLLTLLKELPSVNNQSGNDLQAPILILPRVFEPDFCTLLIQNYTEQNLIMNAKEDNIKNRNAVILENEALKTAVQNRLFNKVIPQISKVFNFQVTRMEQLSLQLRNGLNSVGLPPHRGNSRPTTAHRRFTLTIALNDAYEGGEVGFCEFNSRTYKSQKGSALIYSSSLLSKSTNVTKGNHYSLNAYLYDEAAAVIREQNLKFLENVD